MKVLYKFNAQADFFIKTKNKPKNKNQQKS